MLLSSRPRWKHSQVLAKFSEIIEGRDSFQQEDMRKLLGEAALPWAGELLGTEAWL